MAAHETSADQDITDQLNKSCHCIAVDTQALQRSLENGAGEAGVYAAILRDQPHLFSATPVFLSRDHLARMQRIVSAIESVVRTPHYTARALETAPAIARFEPGTRGVFLGYDFHLSDAGPQLIEINTNAGGALLNTALARAQRACCEEVEAVVAAPGAGESVEAEFVAMFRNEWRLQRGQRPWRSVAIVDENPESQYLYPEFRMFRELFERAGLEARILDPRVFEHRDGALVADGRAVDFVYNRLTDFYLETGMSAALRSAYLAGDVVVTPGPRDHALYADKRHLIALSDAAVLQFWGVPAATIALLQASVPRTVLLENANREQMWSERKRNFFKPACGYGSKAAYRGDKITRGVWEAIAAGDEPYVAQRLVPPSERTIRHDGSEVPLKLDVRCYVYDGVVQLVAARLYQGQTTNFRTAGGGFAPVFTEAEFAAA
ncbi:MAG TPA: hypothetical protein VEL28_11835 [Candidatus Binatia bacterium]|nr:hypothetical protein [Candidatus Binatia bacterium]